MSITNDIQKLYIGYLGRAADQAGLDYWEAKVGTDGWAIETVAQSFADQPEYDAIYGTDPTRVQLVAKTYEQLFGRAADSDGLEYWVNGGGKTVPANLLVLAFYNGASAADQLVVDNKVEVANYYTDTKGDATNYDQADAQGAIADVTGDSESVATAKDNIDAGTSGSGTGQTFTLTTATDTLTGTSGNDTFVGTSATTSPTYTAADNLTGGDGTDTLNLTIDILGANSVPAPTVSGIEVISVRNVSGAQQTIDGNNFIGETAFASDRSTGAVVINNVASGTEISVIGNGAVTNGATTANFAAAATSAVVNVKDGTTAGAITLTGAGTTGLTINSTGATNTVGAIDHNGTSIATTTINATTALETTGLTVGTVAAGGQKLVISGAAGDRAATTTAAAKSAVTLGAADADYKTIDASGLTAGGVSLTMSATTTTVITGGAGNDQITTSHSAHTGTVDAGAGTDTLVLANSVDLDTTTEGAIYKNFEVLTVSDNVSIDMDLLTASTIGAVTLADAGNATSVTDMSATQAANFTIAALNAAATIGVKGATTVGTQNTLNITVSDGDTTGSEAVTAAGDLTVAGVETISITATDDLTLATMANMSGITSMTVTGGGDVSITTGVHAVTANMAVNLSGLTAATTFNAAAATGNAIAITGSATAVDTISVGVVGGYVVSTGAGADVINLLDKTSGTSGDQVTAGAGADTISFGTEEGQTAMDWATFVFAAGDSVSNATGVTDVTNADTISAIAWDDGGVATAGQKFTIDTEVSATAVTVSTTAATLGTTTVSNAYDFYVKYTAASTDVYVYQDTDGDKILEAGEFMVKLVGDAAFVANNANDFSISSGNLLFTSNDAA